MVDLSSDGGGGGGLNQSSSAGGRLTSSSMRGGSQPARSRLYKGKRLSDRHSSIGSDGVAAAPNARHPKESEDDYINRVMQPLQAKSKEDLLKTKGRNYLGGTISNFGSLKFVAS